MQTLSMPNAWSNNLKNHVSILTFSSLHQNWTILTHCLEYLPSKKKKRKTVRKWSWGREWRTRLRSCADFMQDALVVKEQSIIPKRSPAMPYTNPSISSPQGHLSRLVLSTNAFTSVMQKWLQNNCWIHATPTQFPGSPSVYQSIPISSLLLIRNWHWWSRTKPTNTKAVKKMHANQQQLQHQ